MAVFETEALVLRSYNLQDADKIVVFLTLDQGLVRGVAKGAKRLKSRFGGTLEPFTIVNLSFYQKDVRELVTIKQIELVRSYFKDTSRFEFLKNFEYISKLLIGFAPPHDPNERLYNMTKVCIETASENPNAVTSVILYFEIWILKLGGFLPSWDKCSECFQQFNDSESAILQFDFQLICDRCRRHKKNAQITSVQRRLFTAPQEVSPKKFVRLSAGKRKEIVEVSGVLRRIISQVLGKDVISEKMLG